jgi:hypothetical protein
MDICVIIENVQFIISKFKADTFEYEKDNEAFIFLNDSLKNLNTGEHRKLLNFHLLNL